MANRNVRIGSLGERAAQRYLEARGYRVLDHNWRSPAADQRGELDLVLRQRRELVVCEVKTRTGDALAHPAEAVTADKAARLRRLAALWVQTHPSPSRSRFTSLSRSSATTARSSRAAAADPLVDRVRIDVVAVRLGPVEPFPVLSIEHLRAVA